MCRLCIGGPSRATPDNCLASIDSESNHGTGGHLFLFGDLLDNVATSVGQPKQQRQLQAAEASLQVTVV
jgi:hypothetical protein